MPDRAVQHSFASHMAYYDHLRQAAGAFTCLALTDGTSVRAICPLETAFVPILGRTTRVWGLPWTRSDMLRDVICPPDEAQGALLPALVRHLRRADDGRGWLVFDRILEPSALWRCLGSLDARTYCTDVVGASDSVTCEGSEEDLTARLSRNFRSNLRKARNKLAMLGDVRFESVREAVALEGALETFLDVEASGWKGEAGQQGALRGHRELLGFYRALVGLLGADGACEINALWAEGRCIASQVCARAGSEYAVLKTAYDERYARVAPGQLLLEWVLAGCSRDPQLRCLSLVSHDEWHLDWRPSALPVHRVYLGLGRVSAPTLVGLLRLRFQYGPRIKRWLLGHPAGPPIVSWWQRRARESVSGMAV